MAEENEKEPPPIKLKENFLSPVWGMIENMKTFEHIA